MTVTPPLKLRPLSIGELLDQVIRLYRRNFLTFIGIVALVQMPLTLLQWVMTLATFGSSLDRYGEFGTIPTKPSDILTGSAWGAVVIFLVG
ncbi:MAG: hypothetical protein GY803_07935, partial [Chloroflexi bacterium]|nr:hypothetical protein [Chloroflexota bacterium]